jgi:hypothetical protein
MRLVDFVNDNKLVMSIFTVLIAVVLIVTFLYGDVVMLSIPVTAIPFYIGVVIVVVIAAFSFRKIKW